MVDIATYERALLFYTRVSRCVASPGFDRVMVIVTPLRKVVRKLEAWRVGRRILEVNDHKLLVCILGKQERRRGLTCRGWLWYQTQNIPILRLLVLVVMETEEGEKRRTSLWANTRLLITPPLAR